MAVLPQSADREVLNQLAERSHWNLYLAQDSLSEIEGLKDSVAVVLCDHEMPQCDWRAAIASITKSAPGCRLILTTPVTDDKLWLEVLERGGFDVVTRPFHERRLVETVSRAWAEIRK